MKLIRKCAACALVWLNTLSCPLYLDRIMQLSATFHFSYQKFFLTPPNKAMVTLLRIIISLGIEFQNGFRFYVQWQWHERFITLLQVVHWKWLADDRRTKCTCHINTIRFLKKSIKYIITVCYKEKLHMSPGFYE